MISNYRHRKMEAKMRKRRDGFTRREFLSASLAGVAAGGLAGVAPGLASAEEKAGAGEGGTRDKALGDMIRRKLGKTGIEIPIVSMGAMNSDNPEIVRASYERGVRHYDTASLYGIGRNEQMLGKTIKEMGIRDEITIGTKERLSRRGSMSDGEARDKFITLTEGSLKRLQTDRVDMLYWHAVDSADQLDDRAVFEAMDRLKKDGKVRATGVSTHQSMAEIINRVTEDELCDVVLTSINVSMADDNDLLEAIDKAAAKGIGIVAMKTQAGGRQLPNRAVFGDYESGVMQAAMLKWVLRHDSITTAIPGYTNFQHMTEDLSVGADLEYTEEEKRFLADNELMIGLGFCRQCRRCLASCPLGAEVPKLVRAHMYAAQYSNFRQARAVLAGIESGRGIEACGSCETCTARCANSVDIAYRIDELKIIYA
jgi:predicted aldo/keto reductase-like oxidoreductase